MNEGPIAAQSSGLGGGRELGSYTAHSCPKACVTIYLISIYLSIYLCHLPDEGMEEHNI